MLHTIQMVTDLQKSTYSSHMVTDLQKEYFTVPQPPGVINIGDDISNVFVNAHSKPDSF